MSEKYVGGDLDSSLEAPAMAQRESAASTARGYSGHYSLFKFNRSAIKIVAGILGVLVVISLLTVLLTKPTADQKDPTVLDKAANYPVGSLAVDQDGSGAMALGEAERLTINGQLRANSGLVITPSAQPTDGIAGQVYFDQDSMQPFFYDGEKYVNLVAPTPVSVTSLGGATGIVGLGNGVQITNGQLRLTDAVLQAAASFSGAAVSSVQGQTGAVVFSGGNGIAINGTVINNTGLLSLGGAAGNLAVGRGLTVQGGAIRSTVSVASGTANIVVTEDGNGNYTISDTSGSNGFPVTLGPTVAQSDTTNNTTINIDKVGTGDFLRFAVSGTDTFVVNQSGVITSGTIGYSQVTGAPATTVTSLGGSSGAISLGSGLSIAGNVLTNAGVTSFGGTTGAVNIGSGLGYAGNSLSNTGVVSITGTIDQINASASSGNVTLSLPQNIATTSSPSFTNLTLAGTLGVTGTTTLGGALNTTGNASFGGTLTASGAVNLSSTLSVTGTTTLQNIVVNGTTSLGNTLSVAGATTLSSTLGVAAAATFGSTVAVQGGNLTLGVSGTTAGVLTFANNLNNNLTTFSSLAPSGVGNATIQIPSIAGGNTDQVCLLALANCVGTGSSVTSTGGAIGYIPVYDAVQNITSSNIFKTGTSIGINTSTPGAFALNVQGGNVNFSGSATVGSDLNVAGVATLNGNTSVTGTSTFTVGTGGTSLGGTLGVTGATTLSTLSVSGTSAFNGNVAVNGTSTLTVGTGATSLGGTLAVAGNTTLSGVLNVSAGVGIVATFSGRVSGADAVANNEFTTLGQVNTAITNASGNYIANSTTLQTANFNISGSGQTGSFTTGSLTVSANATVGGTLGITGLTTLNGGATIAGSTSITGTTTINTTGTASTTIGNATSSFTLVSSGLNVTAAGALSGVTGFSQTSGNFSQTGTGTFGTGTGAVALNGATTINSTATITGNTSISGASTLTVGTGATSFGGSLTVAGLTSLNGGVSVTGTSTLAGNVSVTGTSTFTVGSGAVTLGSLGTGIVQSGATGVLSSGTVDRNGTLLTGQTNVANGGTGATTAAGARTNLGAAASGANSDITSLSAVTSVGSAGTSLTLQGNGSSVFTATSGGFSTSLGFAGPTANVSYLLPAAAAGTYNICTSVGNCAGAGGGVTTAGGTTGTLALFSGSQSLGDSLVSQSGSTVTVGGTLAVNTIAPTAALLLGVTGQNLTMQGAAVSISSTAGGFTNTLSFATPSGSSKNITVPNASGTVAVSASGPLAIDANGNLTCATCTTSGGGAGGAVDSLNAINGAVTLQGTTNQVTVTNDAGTRTITLSLPQDINTSSSPTFSSLSLTNNLSVTNAITAGSVSSGSLSVTGAATANSFNGLTLTANTTGFSLAGGTAIRTVNVTANVTLDQNLSTTSSPTFSALTLGSALSVANGGTGATTAAGARTNLGAAASGANSDITSITGLTTALSAGQGGTGVNGATAANGSLLIGNGTGYTLANLTQGSGISITNGAGSITVAVDSTICTTAGNCAGAGGGVTTAGGTTGTIALFTGAQAIGNSILSQSGATVTVAGTLAATNLQGNGSGITNLNASNLVTGTVPSARITGSYTGITGTGALAAGSISTGFGVISTGNNITTTAALQGNTLSIGTGTFTVSALGAITAATGITSSGAITFSSLNSAGVVKTDAFGALSTGTVTLGTETTGNYVATLGTLTGLTTTGNTGAGSTPTLSVTYGSTANTAAQGNTAFTFTPAGNLTGSLSGAAGAGFTTTTLAIVNNPTFSGLVTANGGLTVAGTTSITGATTINTTGTANTSIGNTTGTLAVTGTTTVNGNTSILGANTFTVGTGATSLGGTLTVDGVTTLKGNTSVAGTSALTVGTGATSLGGTLTVTGTSTLNGAVSITGANALTTGTGAVTLGALGAGVVQSNASGLLSSSAIDRNSTTLLSGTLSVANGGTGNATYATAGVLYYNGTNFVSTAASTGAQCLISTGAGVAPTWGSCLNGTSSGVSSLNTFTGAVTVTGTANQVNVNNNAGTITLSTPQDINTTAAVTFGSLNIATATNPGVGTALIFANNTNVAPTGNLADLQTNGTSRFAVNANGNVTATGSIAAVGVNGGSGLIQGTGGLTVGGTITFSGLSGAGLVQTNASGVLSSGAVDRNSSTFFSNTLTPANGGTGVNGSTATNGSLLIGNGTGYTLANLTQGSGITITNGAGAITIATDSTICTTSGNCAGAGTGVTTAGGTTGTIALFTASQAIGNSILSQAGTTVTAAGTIVATFLQGDGSGITNLNASNLASGTVPSARVTGSYTGITGTGALTAGSIGTGFGTISTANNISTSAALQGNTLSIGSGTFAVNATGAITGATGITSSGTITLSSLNVAGVVKTNASGVLSTGSVALGTETTGNYVATLGTLTGLTTTGNTGAGSTPTLSVTYGAAANTAAQGNTAISFTGAGNLTGTVSGTAGGGISSNTLAIVNNPTFSGLITANGGLTVATGQTFTNAGATLNTAIILGNFITGGVIGTAAATVDGATTFNIAQTTGGQTLSLPAPTATTAGRIVNVNSTSSAGFIMHGATIPAGQGRSFMWNGTTWTLMDNAVAGTGLTQSGNVLNSAAATSVVNDTNITGSISSNVLTLGFTGTLAVTRGGTGASDASTARVNLGAASRGANSDITSITGLTTALSVSQGGTGSTSYTTSGVIYSDGTRLISTAASTGAQCLISASAGAAPTWGSCLNGTDSGVTSVNAFTGAITIAGTANQVNVNNATNTVTLSLPQDINTTSAVSFGRLSVVTATNPGAGSALIFANNTNATPSGNLVDVQTGGVSRFNVSTTGAVVATSSITSVGANSGAGLIQGTGGLTVGGTITFSGFGAGVLKSSAAGLLSVGTVALGTETTGNYVASVGAGTGTTIGGTTGAGSVPTVNVTYGSTANTAAQGNVTFTCPSGTGNITGTGNSITIGAGGACANLTVVDNPTFSGLITANGGLAIANGQTLTNAGSSLNTAVAIANLTTGGVIGTAAATVDGATTFNVNQTTTGQTLTLPSPTTTTAGRVVYVNNIGTASFTMYGVSIAPAKSQQYIWNGSAWTSTSVDTDTDTAGAGATSVVNDTNITGSISSNVLTLGFTGTLAVTRGGTGASDASTARVNLGAASRGANSDITSITGLTTALSVSQGGTGNNSFTTSGVVYFDGTRMVNTAASTGAQCLVSASAGAAPTWGSCTTGTSSGVTSVNTFTGAVNIVGTANQVNIANATNTVTLSLPQDINTTSAVSFGRLSVVTATNPAAGQALIFANNTNASPTGNLIDVQTGGVSRFNVSTTGAVVAGGSITSVGVNSGSGLIQGTGGLTVGGTTTLSSLAAGVVKAGAGGVLTSGSVTLGTETTGNYVANIGTVTGLTLGGTTGAGSVPTFSVNYGSAANTAAQGNTTFTCPSGTGNLSGTGNSITVGAGGTCNSLTVVNNPTFSGLVTANGGLTIATGQTFTNAGATLNTAIILGNFLTGGAIGTAAATVDGATTFNIAQTTAGQTLSLPAPTATTAGRMVNVNNTGTASFIMHGATMPTGQGRSFMWNGTAWTLMDNAVAGTGLTQSGNVLSSAAATSVVNDTNITGSITSNFLTLGFTGTLSVARGGTGASDASTARVNLGAASRGANSDITSITGLTTALSVAQGGTGSTSYTTNGVIYSDGTRLISTAASTGPQCLISASAGAAPTWGSCTTGSSGVSSVNSFTGAVNIVGTANQVIVNNATNTVTLSLPQDINTTSAVSFGRLSVVTATNPGAGSALIFANNTNASPTGNLIDVQTGGVSRFNVSATGNVVATGSVTSVGVNSGTGLIQGTGGLTVSGTTTLSSLGAGIVKSSAGGVLSVGTVALGTETTGNYVASLGAGTGTTIGGTTGAGAVPTVNVTYGSTANTAAQGSTTFTCPSGTGNLTGTGNSITIGAGGTCTSLTVVNNPTFSGLVTANGGLTVANLQTLTNAGASLNTAIAVANVAAGGAIGTAAATVDGATTFNVNQTTAGQTLTLPSPTTTTAGRVVYVNNVGTASFTMYGVVLAPAKSQQYMWNGTAWTATSVDGSGSGATSVVNDTNVTGSISANVLTLGWTGSLAVARGGTGATDASTARVNLAAATRGANSDITSLSGLTTALSIAQGGTGSIASAYSTNGVVYYDGTRMVSTAASTGAQCLISTGAGVAPSWGACTTGGGGGVTSVGTIDSQAKNANGAVIVGASIFLQTADASNAGLVGTGAQTFAGVKTFNNDVNIVGTAVLGASSSVNGSLTFRNATNANTATFTSAATGTSYNLTLPLTSGANGQCLEMNGTAALTFGNCGGGVGGQNANKTLSNLNAPTAINQNLLPGSAGVINLGSSTLPFGLLNLAGTSTTPGSNNFTLTGNATAARTITFPDLSGTVCLSTSTNCGTVSGDGGVTTVGALDGGTDNANGATITTTTIFLQSASASFPGLVTTGAQTLAGAKTLSGNLTVSGAATFTSGTGAVTLNGDVTLAAGKSISLVGGITSTRPASPTEGMLYYDTTTKSLLVYANGKWQADRSTSTVTVGTSAVGGTSSAVASKGIDGADFVNTSDTSAQTVINNAIAALPATGGSVYLMEGTYIIDGSISIPNNTTLSGSGDGTVIKFKNGINANFIGLVNSDTTTGTKIVISNLRIDGNRANQTGVAGMGGIVLTGMGGGSGATARAGAKILNLSIENIYQNSAPCYGGVHLLSSNNNIINSVRTIGIACNGIFVQNSNFNTVSSNVTTGSSTGIYISGSSGNTVTGNVSHGNNNGIAVFASSINNNISGNNIVDNISSGIWINGSNQNGVSTNKIHNSGGSANNDGIIISNTSPNNSITNNDITDTSCTGTCHAINIQDAASASNYLASNRHTGTTANQSTINDVSPNAIYANQTDGTGNLINRNQGGLTVGTKTATTTLTLQGSLSASQLSTPTAPTLATVGTAGSTSRSYAIVASDGAGDTLASTAATIATSNATLTGANYVTISWAQVSGAVSYKIYRTASAGTPATTGLIGTVSGNVFTLNDTGLAGNAAATPAANTTGNANIAGQIQGGSLNVTGNTTLGGTLAVTGASNFTGAATFGVVSSTTGQIRLANAASAFTTTMQTAATAQNTVLTIPAAGATDTFCLQTLANCGGAGTGVTTVGALDGGTANANGATITTSTIFLQSASNTNPGLVNTLSQTFAGAKTFNGALTVAAGATVSAGQTITLVGGITSTRPASPTAGMLYFDSTTNTMLQYNGSKWVSDRKTSTVIVAASSSSQTVRDSADYVATGTGDQATINTALTAAAGGSVYLAEGTYSISAAISVPNDTTLFGAGAGTLITIPNAQNGTYNMIHNADQTTGTGVTVRDLQINGNSANQTAGIMRGISFIGMGGGTGGTARPGGTIRSIISKNIYGSSGYAISLDSSANNFIVNSYAQNGSQYGIHLSNANNNTLTGNTAQGNSFGFGITSGSSNNTLTSNTAQGNSNGIAVISSNNTVTGNTVTGSAARGIYVSGSNNSIAGNTVQGSGIAGIALVDGTVSNNSVTGNKVNDSGSTSGNNGIYLDGSANGNTIVGNDITDTSCTTTCHAINIVSAGPTSNYLANNRHSGTTANPSTVNDLGTSTIYANQTDSTGNLINRNQGGLSVGRTTAGTSLDLQGALRTTVLPTPAAPTVTVVGTAGTTTYRYLITALDGLGETVGSTVTQITTGNATLSGTNYNQVTWAQVGGAVQYRIYRCSGAACTPANLATVNANVFSYNDAAAGAPSGSAPSTNTTGKANVAGQVQGNNFVSTATSGSRYSSGSILSSGTGFDAGWINGPGKGFYTYVSGSGVGISVGDSVSGAVNFTGTMVNIAQSSTYDNTFNETGKYLNIARTNSSTVGALTLSGDLVNLQSTCTISGTGTCTDTARILNLAQNNATSSGTVLNVVGAGAGNLANLDATNATANGVLIDVQSASSTQYALRVTTNNGATTALSVLGDGNVTMGGNLSVTGTVSASNLSGTNTGNVTLAGENYLSLAGQVVTANAVNLAGTNVTGTLPMGKGGTGATTFTTNGLVYSNGTSLTSTAAGTTGQCLIATTGSAPTFGSCGATTLQGGYNGTAGATPEIILDSTRGGLTIRDNATAIAGNLLEIQNNAGTRNYLGVSTTGISVQNSNGNAFVFDSTTNQLRIYENTATPTNYATISYASGVATFGASSGTTQIGNGSGNVTANLTGANDIYSFNKTYTAAAAYNLNDFSIQRTLTGGSNALGGSVLKIEDLSTGTASAPNVLQVNQNNTSATGNLILAQTGGSTTRFSVSTAGNGYLAGSLQVAGLVSCSSVQTSAAGLFSCGAGGSGVTTVGAFDGGTANANGATITGSSIFLQSASATNPGLVNTIAQTFAGVKTFNNNVNTLGLYQQAGNAVINTITGTDNTFLGRSGNTTTTGSNNTASGSLTLRSNTTGYQNTATGVAAMEFNTSGYQNTANGSYALQQNTNGYYNNAAGAFALQNNTTGFNNNAMGFYSLQQNTTGTNNTGVGSYALGSNTTGFGNTALGYYAGFQDNQASTFFTPNNIQNSTAIGNGAQVQASNSLILGGQGANQVNVGIGTTIPTNVLSVSPLFSNAGTAGTGGVSSTTITGVGTSFTSAMVGAEIIFANGNAATAANKRTILSFTNATTITVTSPVTIAAGTAYRIHYAGLQVTNAGVVKIGTVGLANFADSTLLATVAEVSTTLRIGTAANGITLTDGGGYTASGTARKAKKVTLTAEYAGSVLDAASDAACAAANSGSMISGFDSSAARQNYYQWSSTGTSQCYDVVVQVPIPTDYSAMNGAPTLSTYNSVGTNTTAVMITALDTSGAVEAGYSASYVGVSSGTTMTTQNLPNLNGTYTAGGYMTFKIRMTSSSGSNVRIGNLTLNYLSSF